MNSIFFTQIMLSAPVYIGIGLTGYCTIWLCVKTILPGRYTMLIGQIASVLYLLSQSSFLSLHEWGDTGEWITIYSIFLLPISILLFGVGFSRLTWHLVFNHSNST